MKKNWKKIAALIMAASMSLSMISCAKDDGKPIILQNVTKAKNVILLIGDGMGVAQIKAGKLLKGKQLCMQNFPYYTMVDTCSLGGVTTDSAAAATAMATGVRTINKCVGKDENMQDLTTIVDLAKQMGKRTGIIATEELDGATPMGFAGHANERTDSATLLESAATTGNVDLFISWQMDNVNQSIFTQAGYKKITDITTLSESKEEKVFGGYLIKADAPSMSSNIAEMAFDRVVHESLEYLSQDKDGFFLMAEGSRIDKAGHSNDMKTMLSELLAFDAGVEAVLKWAKGRNDTVVIVTADHETGDLQLGEGLTQAMLKDLAKNQVLSPYFVWGSTEHTSKDVFCYINGAEIDFSRYSTEAGRIKNTDIFHIMHNLMLGQ